jgi:hypothetical protein
MPRPTKGARLYLRKRRGREPVWVIRDGAYEEITGCCEGESAEAERRLGAYIEQKHDPRTGEGDPRKVLINDILNVYADTITANEDVKRKDVISYTIGSLLGFWGTTSPTSRTRPASILGLRPRVRQRGAFFILPATSSVLGSLIFPEPLRHAVSWQQRDLELSLSTTPPESN